MRGVVERVNISKGGLPKSPIEHAEVTVRGIAGDACRNTRYHGGPLQALLLVTMEGIEELSGMGFPVYPGALGENLTTRGLDRHALRAGQIFQAGSVLLQLTKLRVPCASLNPFGAGLQRAVFDKAAKRGDTASPAWALGGFYARIVRPGEIRRNDIIELTDQTA